MAISEPYMSLFDLIRTDPDLPYARLRDWRRPRIRDYREIRAAHFPLAATSSSGLIATRVAEVAFAPGSHVWDRGSRLLRLALVEAGAAVFVRPTLRDPLGPGAVFTRPTGEEHDLLIGPQGLRIIVLCCVGRQAMHLHRRILGAAGAVLTAATPVHTERFRRVLDDAIDHPVEGQAMAGLHAELILRSLVRDRPIVAPRQESRALATFQRCRAYIVEHALGLRSIGAVAAACRVDPSHLGRLFQRFEGTGPHDFLTRMKMGHAADLLTTTDLSVGAIADALGYPDGFTFSRAFKRLTGRSPKAYRSR